MPTEVSGSAPFQVVLAAISRLVGPEATGKTLVLAILIGGALASFSAIPTRGIAGRMAAATLFTANPFVFGRLHYGQLFLLAGYALLPWVAMRLRALSATPNWSRALLFALSLSLVGLFSTHLFLVACVFSSVVVACFCVRNFAG